jgi:hypothetical protein
MSLADHGDHGKPRAFGLALLKNLAYWEKAKWRVAKCKEAKRKAAYPSSVPIPG